MSEVEIKFSREGIEGISPVGASLVNAMRRFGIRQTGECDVEIGEHHCLVTVTSGEAVLSPPGTVEKEHFSKHKRRAGERLACQAVVAKPGELTIMTAEKEKKKKAPATEDRIVDEFAELPLDEKIAKLVKMEAVALSETISFVLDSPFKVFEKIGDLMAEVGMKKDMAPKAGAGAGEKTAEPSETAGGESKAKKPRRSAPRRAKKDPETP